MHTSVKLRSESKSVSNLEIRSMLFQRNFYCKSYPWNEDYANDAGTFTNDFTENLDGTVTDRSTGLMWQKTEAPDYCPWHKAQPYVDQLNAGKFAGYSDWRLPTIEEIASLMSHGKQNDGLYLSHVFTNKMWFWSCDPGSEGAGRQWTGSKFAWAINFDYGSVFCLETTNAQNVRAVRSVDGEQCEKKFQPRIKVRSVPKDFTNCDLTGLKNVIRKYNFFCKGYEWNREFSNDQGESQNDYRLNDDGTCIDFSTGLMWQTAHRPNYGRWEDAHDYILQLNKEHFAGFHDWRLPTIEEAISLFTPQKQSNGLYINPLFTDRMWLWTSDIKDKDNGLIWNANLLYGSIFWIDEANGQDIRAVRTIEGGSHE
jgi:hypothetical protein